MFAIETKFMTSIRPARQLDPVYRQRWGRQARANARTVRLLLKSRHIDIAVRPVVLLSGFGVPTAVPGFEEESDGTWWARTREIHAWQSRLLAGEIALGEADEICKAIGDYMARFRPRGSTTLSRRLTKGGASKLSIRPLSRPRG